MTDVIAKSDLLAVFGTCAAAARALGIHPQAVQQWTDGPIPELRQYQLREKFPEQFGADRIDKHVGQA